MVYLPNDLESEARQAVENFQRATELLEALNAEARLRLDKRKAQRKKKKNSSRKATSKKKAAARKNNRPKKS